MPPTTHVRACGGGWGTRKRTYPDVGHALPDPLHTARGQPHRSAHAAVHRCSRPSLRPAQRPLARGGRRCRIRRKECACSNWGEPPPHSPPRAPGARRRECARAQCAVRRGVAVSPHKDVAGLSHTRIAVAAIITKGRDAICLVLKPGLGQVVCFDPSPRHGDYTHAAFLEFRSLIKAQEVRASPPHPPPRHSLPHAQARHACALTHSPTSRWCCISLSVAVCVPRVWV